MNASSDYVWRYGAASATVQNRDGSCCVDLRGPITRRALDQVKVDLLRTLPKRTYAVVIGVSNAALAVTLDELLDAELDSHMHGVLEQPAAFVANEEQVSLLHRHCANLIDHGLVRIAVTSWADALAWAARKVAFAEWGETGVKVRVRMPPKPSSRAASRSES